MARFRHTVNRVHRLIRNVMVDLPYGGFLGVNINPRDILRRADTRNRILYTYNSDSEALHLIFTNRIKPDDVLVDVGCGRGRVINWWLHQGYKNKMIGIELDAETAEQTRRRLKTHANVAIITGNAVEHLPPDGTIFYLYNPFDPPIVNGFRDRMKALFFGRHPITILYYSCKHIDVFHEQPDWDIEMLTLASASGRTFPPLAVITLKPEALASPSNVAEPDHALDS
jgi:SAM-dependent methyltransferase